MKDSGFSMVALGRTAWRWSALAVLLLASACGGARLTSSAEALVPPSLPRGSMWVNTFPPISSNGAVLRFLHYGLDEGLSQSSVLALAQDNLGFLWVGTQDGLNRFDGYSFKVFRPNPNDPASLSGSEIFAIVPGIQG